MAAASGSSGGSELPIARVAESKEGEARAGGAEAPQPQGEEAHLSFLDKYLSFWILLAAGIGLGLGQAPAVIKAIKASSVGTTNIPIAVGLILMIYPPLAKVRWNKMRDVFSDLHLLVLTLALNWVIGPFLMYFLAIAFFHDAKYSDFMSGLSLVGCARCIAMVIVWCELAKGDREYCAAIVALNSLVTILLYSPYAVFFLITLPKGMLGSSGTTAVDVTMGDIAASVGIYLGIPLAAGLLSWLVLTKAKGKEWYYEKFSPPLGRLTLAALLFTVIILFASQSKSIVRQIGSVLYAAVPLAIYFLLMFIGTFYLSYWAGATYSQATTLSFTAASNNFELALAVAVGTFGLNSGQALMSVVGALIEIPTMLSLVKTAEFFRRRLYHGTLDKKPAELVEAAKEVPLTDIQTAKA